MWPVQYMGFFPSGWSTLDDGQAVKTVPVVVQSGGFKNKRFRDDRFARFGSLSSDLAPFCTLESGAEVPCPQRVPILISRKFPLVSPLPLDGPGNTRTFHFRMRFRNTTSPGGFLADWGVFRGNASLLEQWYVQWRWMGDAHPEWTTWEGDLVAEASQLGGSAFVTEVSLGIYYLLKHILGSCKPVFKLYDHMTSRQ